VRNVRKDVMKKIDKYGDAFSKVSYGCCWLRPYYRPVWQQQIKPKSSYTRHSRASVFVYLAMYRTPRSHLKTQSRRPQTAM
jgi:hypothetical protein